MSRKESKRYAVVVTDVMIERAAVAFAQDAGCSGGCANRPCEPDYRAAEFILRRALEAPDEQ